MTSDNLNNTALGLFKQLDLKSAKTQSSNTALGLYDQISAQGSPEQFDSNALYADSTSALAGADAKISVEQRDEQFQFGGQDTSKQILNNIIGVPTINESGITPPGKVATLGLYAIQLPKERAVNPKEIEKGLLVAKKGDSSAITKMMQVSMSQVVDRTGKVVDDFIKNQASEAMKIPKEQISPGIWDSFKIGLLESSLGEYYQYKTGQELPKETTANMSGFDRIVAGFGDITGSLPAMIFGGLLGNVGGAFAIEAALRELYHQLNKNGKIETASQFGNTLRSVALKGGNAALVGAMTGEVGKVAEEVGLGVLARTATEVATITTMSDALKGRLPTLEDIAMGVITLGGMKIALSPGATIRDTVRFGRNLNEGWVKTGILANGIKEGIKEGKIPEKVLDELDSEEGIKSDTMARLREKVQEVEIQQVKLILEATQKKEAIDAEKVIKQEQRNKIKEHKKQEQEVKKAEIKQIAEDQLTIDEQAEFFDGTVKSGEELTIRDKHSRYKDVAQLIRTDINAGPVSTMITDIEKNGNLTPTEIADIVKLVEESSGKNLTVEQVASKAKISNLIDYEHKDIGYKIKSITSNDKITLNTPTPEPINLDTIYRESNIDYTTGLRKMFENNPKALKGPEGFSRFLINEVNHSLNGSKDVEVNKAIDALERLVTEPEKSKDHFVSNENFNDWLNFISDAAVWARKTVRSTIKRTPGEQLNMMIPFSEIPKMVRDLLNFWDKGLGYFKDVEYPGKKLYRNEEIWRATGYWVGKDGMYRYEIPANIREALKMLKVLTPNSPVKLSEIADISKLIEQVPGLKDTKIMWNPELKTDGVFLRDKNTLAIKTPQMTDSAIHELQHSINEEVGSIFTGTNPKYARLQQVYNIVGSLLDKVKDPSIQNKLSDILTELRQEKIGSTRAVEVMNSIVVREKNSAPNDAAKVAESVMEALKINSFKSYLGNPGEMESRLSVEREKLTNQQRKDIPPWETLEDMLAKEEIKFGIKYPEDQGTKLYSGLDPSKINKELIKLGKNFADAMDKAREVKKFKLGVAYRRTRDATVTAIYDRSGNVKRELLNNLDDEGYRVIQKLVLTKGASARSLNMLNQLEKEVYRGLSRKEKNTLDDVILARRMIDIGKYKTPKEFEFPEGKSPSESVVYIDQFQKFRGLSNEQADNINQRAETYFDWMKKPLKDLLDNGLISEQEYSDLVKHSYRKIKLVDIFDKKYTAKIGRKILNVYDSGIDPLATGRDTDIYEPSSEIMALEVFNRTYGRIANNEANKALLEIARDHKDNPLVRIKENKEDKIPSGWHRLYVYEKGERKTMWASPEMAEGWLSKDAEISYKLARVAKWVFGAPVTRTFATGIEWGFAVANLPRDILHAWWTARVYTDGKWKSVYNPTAIIAGPQMILDQSAVFTDSVLRKGRYQDYINGGGGMEFLALQGRLLRRGKHLRGPLDPTLTFGSYFGETTEIMTRLSIRERVIKMRARQQGISVEQARKNSKITTEADFAARDYLDFSQGGSITKAVDTGIPYLNAAVQGTRGMLRLFKDRPIEATYKLAQFGLAISGTYIACKTFNPKTMAALQGDRNGVNNIIIPIGDKYAFTDERGQTRYFYIKIPIDQTQRFFKAFFEAAVDKWLGNEVDVDRLTQSLRSFSPVDTSSLPPTVSAFLGYVTNKDFWSNKDIWRKTAKPFSYPNSAQETIPGVTPPAYTDFGQATGFSPERTKYAVQQLLTRGSMWTAIGDIGYTSAFTDIPKSKRKQNLAYTLARMPVFKRFIGVTNPYSKFSHDVAKAEEAASIKRFVENRGLDAIVDGLLFNGIGSKRDVVKYIKQFKDLKVRKRLLGRYEFSNAIKNLPNRSFWLSLQNIPDVKARAAVYAKFLNKADEEEKINLQKGMIIVKRAGGVISNDFMREVIRLRRSQGINP